MVFRKLQSLRQARRSKREVNDSLGVSLKPEECFTITISEVLSDKATKDSVFYAISTRLGVQNGGSASSMSSVTTNSGATSTLRSRQTAEYSRREKKEERAVKQQKEFNSVAASNKTDKTEEEAGSFMNAMMNILPSCCAQSSTIATLDTDDRSIAVLTDENDTTTNLDDAGRGRGRKNTKKDKQKESIKFLGFLRRNRSPK